MDNKKYLLRVKHRDKVPVFIKLDQTELQRETFIAKAFACFGIKQHINTHVRLSDHMNTTIDDDVFEDFVVNFHKDINFFICFEYEIDYASTTKVVTPFLIEDYLVKTNRDWILREAKEKDKINQNIAEATRQQFVQALFDFTTEFFQTTSVKKQQKIMTATAAAEIIPQYREPNGVQILVGYMDNRQRYLSQKNKLMAKSANNQSMSGSDLTGANCSLALDSDVSQIVEEMKSIVVDESNMDLLKAKLKATREYRAELLQNNQRSDVLELCPYFFVNERLEKQNLNVQLISFEFEDKFRELSADPDAFVTKWNDYSSSLANVLHAQYSSDVFCTTWPEDIDKLFILIKLLPPSAASKKAKNAEKIETFHKAIDKLIIFKKVGTPEKEMNVKSNKHPYIVACGENKDKIIRYFIFVGGRILCIPKSFNIVGTFDLFFKLYLIFDWEFDKNIACAMTFIQKFIYGLKTKEPTTRMIDINNFVVRDLKAKRAE